MPVFNVPISGPNGSGKGTIQVNASDAAAAVQNASQGGNTPTGGATLVGGGSSGGGGGSSGGGGSGGGGGGGGGGTSPSDTAALQNFFGQTAGFSREDLAERARQFDATLAWQKQQWQQQGLPELEIEQRAQALREWQAQQDVQQQRSALGLQYLQQASQMGGPADVFQQADFIRGAQQRGDVPVALASLASNTQLPAFQGAGAIPPIAQTPGLLTSQLTGGATSVPPTTQLMPGVSITGASGAPAAVPGGAAPTTYPGSQYAEGTFLKGTGDAIGVVQGGKLHIFPNFAAFTQAGGKPDLSNVQTIDMNAFNTLWTPDAPGVNVAPPPAAPPAAGLTATGTSPLTALPTAAAAAPYTTPGGYSPDQVLNTVGSIFKAGPTSLTPGSLEKLDPNELSILKSGGQKLGYDVDAWLRAYSRGGIGQAAGVA